MLNLTPQEMATLANLMNSVSGMENARVLMPIYDKLMVAMRAVDEKPAAAV